MGTLAQRMLSGIITGVLAFTFYSSGMFKVWPNISKEVHEQMKKEFVHFAKVHPAVHFGYKIDPAKYMLQVGIVEVIGATLLIFGPKPLKLMSSLVLISVMVGALYTLFSLGEPFVKLIPASCILLMLFMKVHFLINPGLFKGRSDKQQKSD